MSTTALKKRFVPLGVWQPDAPEFAPGFLDQIVNVIPVYGVYRTLQKISAPPMSICPGADNLRRVTGTYVHRISIDQTIDIMQPVFSELAVEDGFQSIPYLVNGVLQEYWQMLRGEAATASTTVLLLPRGVEKSLYGNFSPPSKPWDSVTNLFARYQYKIATGFTGTYEFFIEFGIVTGDPTLEAGFTVLAGGTFTRSGDLAVLGDTTDGEQVRGALSIPNASFTDPGNQHRYAWRIRHTIEQDVNESLLDPDRASSAATSGSSLTIASYRTHLGSQAEADVVLAIKGLVAGVWPPDPSGSERSGDETFVVSDELWSTSIQGRGFFFKMPFPQFKSLSGHKIKLRYSMDSLAQFIGIGLYQGVNGSLIKQWGARTGPTIGASVVYNPNAAVVSDTVMEITLNLDDNPNEDPLGRVSNWNDVWLLFFAWPPTASLITTRIFRPTFSSAFQQKSEGNPWILFGVGEEQELIGDSSDATGIRAPSLLTTEEQWFRVRVGGYSGPKESVNKAVVKVRAATSSLTDTVFMHLALEEPNDLSGHSFSGSRTIQPIEVFPGALQEYSFEANRSVITALGLQNLFVKVTELAGSTTTLNISEVWVELDTGTPSRARLHGVSWFSPSEGDDGDASPIDVSWLRLDGPADVSDIQQDSIRAYVGTVEEKDSATQVGKIYEIGSPSFADWEDVSNVTTPYSSNGRDKSWSFCNFGSMVVATNYADPVQAKYEGETDFIDLIGFDADGVPITVDGVDYDDPAVGGVYPRARFVATINAFLCLANIDPTSVDGTATPYSFWCSRYAQPQYFSIGDTTWQSSVFQLVSTPGEITGLVGGEYGIIFKENSIWRADYVGLPQIFNFTQLSGEQGTVHPRSIVKVDDDVYFWGIGGIYVIRQGRELEELAAQGSVRKFLFDTQFEDYSISTHKPTFESEASARVIGGYDAYTGCILWAYQTKMSQEEWFKCDSVLVYSPRENRFTFLRGDMTNPSFPSDRMISTGDLFTANDLKISGFLSLGNRQLEDQTYLMKTILALREIPPQVVAFSGPQTTGPSGVAIASVYEQLYRSNTISSSFFGAPIGVEIEIHKVRPIMAIERVEKAPQYVIWVEANQSPAVGDGTGHLVVLNSMFSKPNFEGWIDIGKPVQGEFFKFALAFVEYNEPIVKEVHGWQVLYRIAGDR